MAKNTRPLSGAAQRKFFRDMLRSDAGVAPEAVDRLIELCSAEIASIRVRLPLVVRRAAKPAVAAAIAAVKPAAVTAAAPAGGGFDPHGFSLIVTFRKGGKDALIAKLDEVGEIEKLREIAKAQHVSLDAGLTDRSDILAALVEGTERRIAHRQAAAS
jgi:hypothetical protein